MKTEENYVALIGDVIGSRERVPRDRLQGDLKATLAVLNRRCRAGLASKLELSAGDEIQGLFRRPEAIVSVVTTLEERLFPARLLYGLGYGPLATELALPTRQLDGPCFHRARGALDLARKQRLWIVASGFGQIADDVLTAIFVLLGEIREQWTETQMRYAREARTALQKQVAQQFGVAESTVSESLKAARFGTIQRGEQAASRLLARFGRGAEQTPTSAPAAKRRRRR